MVQTTISKLKKGDFFTLKYFDDSEVEVPEKLVWIRGDHDRSSKTYSCYKFEDVNHENFFKGSRTCFTEIFF